MRRIVRILLLTVLLASTFLLAAPVTAQSDGPLVLVLTASGPLTPTMSDYIQRGLDRAAGQQAEVVVLQLDTPGGSIDLMNHIVQQIRSSSVPVVVYVSPQNAMAGSAGTIITLAGHLAAMAPETTIGAASPVGSQGEDIGETMESKVKEMLKASARTLTGQRPPEAVQLAQEMIESARAVTVDEAVAVGLVDLRAASLEDLLDQIDGRQVFLNDQTITLHTRGAEVQFLDFTFIEQTLQMLVDPNLVFLLLAIGVQALLIELSSPGGWVAGFIGVLCLILAVYGLGILPVNWFGILLVVLAFALFILDIKAPTHGALTIAGAGSFIAGALILFNGARPPGFPGVSVPLVIGSGIFIAATFFTALTFALRAQRAPVVTGKEAIPGRTGIVRRELNPRGIV
ncbi:MAG: nodulation protein NfeD, partial [Chloroflexi bacterium]|nr:nodulation protein NfeD [Chloroflexota bacterium]